MKPHLTLTHPTEAQSELASFIRPLGERRGWTIDIRLTGETVFHRPGGLWMRADVENPRQYMKEYWKL